MSDNEFTILLIENDKELTALLEKLLPWELRPRKVATIVKHHVAEATEVLQTRFLDLRGLIVDIMLPRNEEELGTLEDLEKSRREMLGELKECRTQTGTEAEERIRGFRLEIDELDAQIERAQDLEGGVNLLAAVLNERHEEFITIPTVFFTARALPHLRARAEKLVKPGVFTWIQKPAPASAIVGALLRGWEGR
ncbi:MAG: hypothetical protein ABSE56_22705 [Bryobacteraceae bacterium]|jgi:CheY-like chemotaxis protein